MRLAQAARLILFINFLYQVTSARGSVARQDGPSQGSALRARRQAAPSDEPNLQQPPQFATRQTHVPSPVPGASFMSLDGLTLVVVFDKPLNLSASVELVERRHLSLESGETRPRPSRLRPERAEPMASRGAAIGSRPRLARSLQEAAEPQSQCHELRSSQSLLAETPHVVEGIHLCALLLTKKTLRLLHKYQVYRCVWSSRVQFIIQLARPVAGSLVRITFKRGTLSEFGAEQEPTGSIDLPNSLAQLRNALEVSVELSRLPLEGLGIPLAPRLALTGPNQVPDCGRFALSAHLSSPYGTRLDESVRLSWSVERLGQLVPPNSVASNASAVSASPTQGSQQQQEANEARWLALKQLVAGNKANNLLLDAQLLQPAPQLYEFRVQVAFSTSLNVVVLNASHQVTRLDIDTPIGTIFGTNLLGQDDGQLNPSQDTLLLADIQVPECANNVKQVGLYWQVSDARVKFEQTYSPFYLARANYLPENANIDFRLNLFYGIRVKKFASTGIRLATGEASLDALISDGLLVRGVGLGEGAEERQVQLYAGKASELSESSEKYNYQWSCFDGKTAQPCTRSLTTSNPAQGANSLLVSSTGVTNSSEPLVERLKARLPVLRVPLSWFRNDAQLWFGLQRFDRQSPSQQSRTEYALVGVQQGAGPIEVSVGPVLLGQAQQRAKLRNPLTGAILLAANAPVVVVGRLGPRELISSFVWHSANMIQPLYWTTRNVTNPLNGQAEFLTELHLSASHQMAHAHQQFQLVACTHSGARSTSASISLDIVQGISECRVDIEQNPALRSLAVSVNYCNIPLGLSPITYQLHVVDTTSSSDGALVDEEDPNGQGGSGTPAPASAPPQPPNGGTNNLGNSTSRLLVSSNADDHLFAASYFDGLAQPLSTPQLTPVFAQLAPISLMLASKYSGADGQPSSAARIRFGVRACDRLQVCRMFYSAELNPTKLLAATALQASQNQSATLQRLTQDSASGQARIQSIQSIIEGARRANLAGNSIAAISLLNGVIGLGQTRQANANYRNGGGAGAANPRYLDEDAISSDRLELGTNGETGGRPPQQASSEFDRLLQVAVRDCLTYGAQSIKRQFHYTDTGQTNIVLHTLARIMSLKQVTNGIDTKFKVLKLLTLLSRKNINDWLKTRLNALPDFSAMQAAFEALFGTFNHYATESPAAAADQLSPHGSTNSNGTSVPVLLDQSQDQRLDRLASQLHAKANKSSSHHHSESPLSKKNRRQEATLAYLKSARLAYRSIISATAVQLPLGATEQYRYGTESRLELDKPANTGSSNTRRSSQNSASISDETSPNSNDQSKQRAAQLAKLRAPAVDIVSSMTHLTELSADTIDVDLRELGSVSLKLDERFVSSIRSKLTSGLLTCRNDSSFNGARQTDQLAINFGGDRESAEKCSSFVLAFTTFAGKSPFRSLDNDNELDKRYLRVPIVEIDILSPIDGSSIPTRELISMDQDVAMSTATVTFAVPNIEPASVARTSSDNSDQQAEQQQQQRYRCYQFDESLNEWVEVAQTGSVDPVDQVVDDERRIRCTFSSVGVFAAFRGKPPNGGAFSVIRLIWLTGSVVMGLVALFTILGCLASSDKKEEHETSGSTRRKVLASSELDRSDPTGSSSNSEYVYREGRRHGKDPVVAPGTSFRNDFNDYPRPGR